MECKIGRRQSGGKLMTGDGESIQVIDLLEATPGIEPGYTVLQSRQGAFMAIDENQPALISFVEN
jgi:hypothetical protein